MVGWHHQLDGHESEQAPGFGDDRKPGVLQSMGSQRFGHHEATELTPLNWLTLHFGRGFLTEGQAHARVYTHTQSQSDCSRTGPPQRRSSCSKQASYVGWSQGTPGIHGWTHKKLNNLTAVLTNFSRWFNLVKLQFSLSFPIELACCLFKLIVLTGSLTVCRFSLSEWRSISGETF